MSQEFRKVYDPKFVDFFRMFTIVDSAGLPIFELTPRAYIHNKGVDCQTKKKNPMLVTNSPERIARVEMLRGLYEVLEPQDISPFEMMGIDRIGDGA